MGILIIFSHAIRDSNNDIIVAITEKSGDYYTFGRDAYEEIKDASIEYELRFSKKNVHSDIDEESSDEEEDLGDESSHVRREEVVDDPHNGSNLVCLDRRNRKADLRSLSAGQDENSSMGTFPCLEFCK